MVQQIVNDFTFTLYYILPLSEDYIGPMWYNIPYWKHQSSTCTQVTFFPIYIDGLN